MRTGTLRMARSHKPIIIIIGLQITYYSTFPHLCFPKLRFPNISSKTGGGVFGKFTILRIGEQYDAGFGGTSTSCTSKKKL